MSCADGGNNRENGTVLHLNGHDLVLHEKQVFLPLKRVLHILSVFNAVGLCTQRVHCRSLAAVEHAVLDAGRVSRTRHLTAERIYLAYKVSLSCSADRRIARHIAYGVQIDRKTRCFCTQTCCSQRRLNTGMTGADHRYIKALCRKNRHWRSLPFQKIPVISVDNL